MADKVAIVQDATTRLNTTSALDPQKCITVSELEDMISNIRVSDTLYGIIGSSYRDKVIEGLFAINTSNIAVGITVNSYTTVNAHSYYAWYLSSPASIEVGSTCYAVFLDPSYNLLRGLRIESHGNFSTKSGVIII